jgi:E3 ubiquitin-protein ligase RNFT1
MSLICTASKNQVDITLQEAFTRPLMLSCKHVFCEACISEWHQREQRTCPMCRAVVQPPGMNLHTDGGTQLLPCLF